MTFTQKTQLSAGPLADTTGSAVGKEHVEAPGPHLRLWLLPQPSAEHPKWCFPKCSSFF